MRAPTTAPSREGRTPVTERPRPETEHLPAGVFQATLEGEIEYANARLAALLGEPGPEALEGRPLSTIFADPAGHESLLAEVERWGSTGRSRLALSGEADQRVLADVFARIVPPTDGGPAIVAVVEASLEEGRSTSRFPGPVEPTDAEEWARFLTQAADAAGIGLAINVVDDHGVRLAFLNQAGARILGRSRRSLTGGLPIPWSLAELGKRLTGALNEAGGGSSPDGSVTAEVPRPDGSTVIIDVGQGAGRYQGHPARFVFFRDVTDEHRRREQLAQAEERYRAIVEAGDRADVALAVLTEGPDGLRLASVNETATEIAGLPRDELVGQAPDEIVRDEDVQTLADPPEREDGPSRVEVVVQRPDGTEVPVEVGLARGHFEGRPATFAFGRDVTEQREAERELEELNRQLEASNADLQRFAYAVSHDLREPLRMVSSYVDLIENRYADDLPEDAPEMLDFVREGTQRMDRMIEALLEYSRVETRGREPEPTESLQALNAALSSLKVRLHEAGVEVTHDELPTVRADPDQLIRLFQNLVANALDHGGGDLTRVHVGAERVDGAWRFTVEDDGRGIAPGDAERVFEVFERGATASDTDGVGLGLAMCERIVERHGGEIGVDPDANEGARFWFTLPDVREEHGAQPDDR